jgi:hypothetical protein
VGIVCDGDACELRKIVDDLLQDEFFEEGRGVGHRVIKEAVCAVRCLRFDASDATSDANVSPELTRRCDKHSLSHAFLSNPEICTCRPGFLADGQERSQCSGAQRPLLQSRSRVWQE